MSGSTLRIGRRMQTLSWIRVSTNPPVDSPVIHGSPTYLVY